MIHKGKIGKVEKVRINQLRRKGEAQKTKMFARRALMIKERTIKKCKKQQQTERIIVLRKSRK